MGVHFVVNLRPDTTTDAFVRGTPPWGWLAAPGNTTRATRAFAAREAGRHAFFADNGNFTRLGQLCRTLAAEAKPLRAGLDQLEKRLDRTARREDLSAGAALAYDRLADKVAAQAQDAVGDPDAALAGQEALGATHLIGVEDITAGTLLALDIEPHLLDWSSGRWRQLNSGVARAAKRLLAHRPELADHYYPVASALDYRAAFDAGRVFADAGLERVAMGFGAYMADNHGSDFVRVGRTTRRLPGRLPQRYVRTAAVARGFFDGYEASAGRPPAGFHFLGLGAPIIMGLAAVAAAGVGTVSFDAMSPIRDAAEGTLYRARPTYLKVRTRSIAEQVARRGGAWRCPCPFCARFRRKHRFDYAAARAALAIRPGVGAGDLRPGGRLYDALPLLSEPKGGPLRQEVTAARMGHNHWVLTQVCHDLDTAGTDGRLAEHVGDVVDRYRRATKLPQNAEGVRIGFEIASGAFA
jgi:hypothetical protein